MVLGDNQWQVGNNRKWGRCFSQFPLVTVFGSTIDHYDGTTCTFLFLITFRSNPILFNLPGSRKAGRFFSGFRTFPGLPGDLPQPAQNRDKCKPPVPFVFVALPPGGCKKWNGLLNCGRALPLHSEVMENSQGNWSTNRQINIAGVTQFQHGFWRYALTLFFPYQQVIIIRNQIPSDLILPSRQNSPEKARPWTCFCQVSDQWATCHFFSKLTVKASVNQPSDHMNTVWPFAWGQSAYRPFHGTETALLKTQSYILLNMDDQKITLLVILDLSSAFDTSDYSILLETLSSGFGVGGPQYLTRNLSFQF